MTKEIKTEALEMIKENVLFGFYSEKEIFTSISDAFYDAEDFDNDWLTKEISKQFVAHKNNSKSWNRQTIFTRLVSVFDQLNKEKIVSLHKAGYTRQDAQDDCREIVDELGAIGIIAKGYCYYHAQDLQRALGEDGMLYIGYDSIEPTDSAAEAVANRIVTLLRENGFTVSWNGFIDTRIEIKNITWQKVYDGVDYNYSRIFSIIEEHHAPKNNLETTTNNTTQKPFWKFWKH